MPCQRRIGTSCDPHPAGLLCRPACASGLYLVLGGVTALRFCPPSCRRDGLDHNAAAHRRRSADRGGDKGSRRGGGAAERAEGLPSSLPPSLPPSPPSLPPSLPPSPSPSPSPSSPSSSSSSFSLHLPLLKLALPLSVQEGFMIVKACEWSKPVSGQSL